MAGTNPEYAASLLALATKLGLPDSYLRHIRDTVRPDYGHRFDVIPDSEQ